MSILVESLKRLYEANKITIELLNAWRTAEKITQEEYDYIISAGVE